MRALEARVAALVGTEAALFVPTGTMANQLALRAWTKPGDEVIAGREAHCWRHESGALAALAGVQTTIIDYTFTADEVAAAFKAEDPYQAHTRVVAVENTHNMGGGVVWDRAELAAVIAETHALGMIAHLDGARLWNAAAATGATEKELATGFDSVSVCLSKGLGAPIGSCVAGTKAFIAKCHRYRKMYGGGMRQVGFLAAAGLHALAHHRARLADDHANARALAEGLVRAANLRVDVARVQTNIVMIDLVRGDASADRRGGEGARRADRRERPAAHPRGHAPRCRSRGRHSRRRGDRGAPRMTLGSTVEVEVEVEVDGDVAAWLQRAENVHVHVPRSVRLTLLLLAACSAPANLPDHAIAERLSGRGRRRRRGRGVSPRAGSAAARLKPPRRARAACAEALLGEPDALDHAQPPRRRRSRRTSRCPRAVADDPMTAATATYRAGDLLLRDQARPSPRGPRCGASSPIIPTSRSPPTRCAICSRTAAAATRARSPTRSRSS